MKHRCCAKVRERGSSWPLWNPCRSAASVERDGKHYCRIHDPEAIKERRKQSQKKWDAKWQAEMEKRELPIEIGRLFDILISAHYGTGYHHIGDGDGISKDDANAIRAMIEKRKH